jgi:hypothetical protein
MLISREDRRRRDEELEYGARALVAAQMNGERRSLRRAISTRDG